MSVKKVNKTTGSTTKVSGLVNSEKVNTMYGAFPSDASASNKLVSDATANEKISDAIADKADKVSSATNGNFAGLDASGNLTDSGKKPSDFQTALTFDNAPTENSNNPVKSNGLYVANRNIYEVMGQNGAKNLLDSSICAVFAPNYVGNKVASANGLTFTWNDGTLIVDGTPTDSSVNVIVRLDFTNDNKSNTDISKLAGKKIIASLGHEQIGTESLQIKPGYFDSNGISYQISSDIGVYGEYTYGLDAKYARTYIVLRGNTSYDNIKLSPMIRLASDTDNTYQPYAKTNRDLTVDVQPIPTMINDLGAKNVMPFILSDIKTYNNGGTWNGNSYTQNGVTFTLDLDENGSLKDVVVDGTATAKCFFTLTNWANKTGFIGKILNGCTEGSPTTFSIITTYRDSNNQYVTDKYQVDNDCVVEDVSGSAILKFMIMVMSGVTISNKKFYPMLRYASITDDTYEPYAKTNQELTDDNTRFQHDIEYLLSTGVKNIAPPFSNQYLDTTTSQNCTMTNNNGVYSFTATGNYGRKTIYYPQLLEVGKRYRFVLLKKFTTVNNVPCSIALRSINNEYSDSGNIYFTNSVESDDNFVKITYPFTAEYEDLYVMVYAQRGTGSGNKIEIKDFMIYDDSITSDTNYEPYAKGNVELTKETTGLLDNVNKNGCKNLLKNNLTDIVQTDGTVTVSDTGVITVNGTVNLTEQNCVIHNKSIGAGDYILSDGSNNDINDNHYHRIYYRVGSGSATRLIGNAKITVSSNTILKLWIYIDPTTHGSYSNEKYYPMLRLASNPDDTYVPYAMGNKEITKAIYGNTIIVKTGRVDVKASSGTVASLLFSLSTSIQNLLNNLEDNETLSVFRINLQSHANILPQFTILTKSSYADILGLAIEANATSMTFYRMTLEHTSANNNKLRKCYIDTSGATFQTPSDNTITSEITFSAYYTIYRKV